MSDKNKNISDKLMSDKSDNKSSEKIFVLCDDRIGSNKQAIAIADKLGDEYTRIDLSYNSFAILPPAIIGARVFHLKESCRSDIFTPIRNAIEAKQNILLLSASRRSASVSAYFKRKNPSIKSVQILWAGEILAKYFDAIAIPEHDYISSYNARNKLIRFLTAPHSLSHDLLKESAERYRNSLPLGIDVSRPITTILLGGESRHIKFNEDYIVRFSQILNEILSEENGSILITTSRRTPNFAAKILREKLTDKNATIIEFDEAAINPYLAFLGLADRIIVSGDSISMMSEAAFIGKPLFIYGEAKKGKLKRFQELLINENSAKYLTDFTEDFKPNDKLHNSAIYIARIIKSLLL